jgi:hypothetical protein
MVVGCSPRCAKETAIGVEPSETVEAISHLLQRLQDVQMCSVDLIAFGNRDGLGTLA